MQEHPRSPSRPTRVYLRYGTPQDAARFVAAVQASRELHGGWVRPAATRADYRTHLARMAPPLNHALLVLRRGDDALVGAFNIGNVVLGPFRSAYLGYYAFAPLAGQGLMREGLQLTLRHALRTLKLHRLEANIQPGNTASIALVRGQGFQLEGYSPRYLKINGRWRDHERWAILAD